jgi:ParB/RepB/Spo0J family partition protein
MSKKTKSIDTDLAAAAQVHVADDLVIEGAYSERATDQMRPSPLNRKRFNEMALQELAANIKTMGIVQPIVIRRVTPTADAPEIFEIVAGERRWRASRIAGLATIPSLLRNLSDLDASKIRIIENLQREDPHPMEEAEGYQQLMLQHGYTADQVADEVKKSRSYVYGRLKLLSLSSSAQEEFLNSDSKLPPSTALLIARIPVPELQAQALGEILRNFGGSEPMSYRAAQRHLQSNYMLDLTAAEFDLSDSKLLAKAGACTKCPKRAGNQPEIFSDTSADVCTDPGCFKEKRAAHIHKIIVISNKRGIQTFDDEKLADEYANENDLVCGTEKLHAMERYDYSHYWDSISSKLPAEAVPAVKAYINDGTKLHPLYDRSELQAALEKAGVCKTLESVRAAADAEANIAPNEKQVQRLKAEDEARRKKEAIAAGESAVRIELYKSFRERAAAGLSLESLRQFVKVILVDDNSYSLPNDVLDVYGLDNYSDDNVCAYIDQATLPEVQLILLDMVLGECLTVAHHQIEDDGTVETDDYYGNAVRFEALEKMATLEGIDPVEVRERVQPMEIDLDAWREDDMIKFIKYHSNHLGMLKDAVLAHSDALLVGMLERAAAANGFHYANGKFLKEAEKPEEPTLSPIINTPEPALAIPDGDPVAMEDEDIAAAMAEPAKATPKKSPKKTVLAPAAAWPFPKSNEAGQTKPASTAKSSQTEVEA